jgi:hypothetical protein
MANGKWVLHYAALNNDTDVQVLEFSSKRKRLDTLTDKIIGIDGKVFLLAVDEPNGDGSSKYFQIYIFEKWQNMFVDTRNGSPFFSNPQYELHLHEYASYEDAYLVALNMREANPLCYYN